MGIEVYWQNSRGETLAVGPSLELRLVDWFPASAACLSAIDPIGDTTFNQKQIRCLAVELDTLLIGGERIPPVSLVQLRNFVDNAIGHAHTYLKFVGD